jgi:hypothetical protein
MKDRLTDRYGKLVGYREEMHNGEVWYQDYVGRLKARYIKETNSTFDDKGRFLGFGDFGASLLYK